MDHAFPVRGIECLGDLAGGDKCTIHRKRTALQAFGERFSFEEFHDEKRHAVYFADVVDRADLRMGDSRDGPRFALKSFELQRGRVSGRCQNFDGDRTLELGIASVIDLTHASSAQRRQDFVSADSLSNRQRHGRPSW